VKWKGAAWARRARLARSKGRKGLSLEWQSNTKIYSKYTPTILQQTILHTAYLTRATSLFGAKKRPAKEETYGTSDSHVVPHHSTDEALSSLTLQIGRDAVLFAWYGRR
jgi:hypothetical protein